MASTKPFEQLTGTLKVYVAPVGTAVPAVDAAPSGSWALLGPTDGDQKIGHGGALEYFRDNDHQGPVKAVRPEEDVMFSYSVVGLTLENYSRILHDVTKLVTTNAGAGVIGKKRMPLKRGAVPTEYALLFRGDALSPYGIYPGQYVVPRGVFDGEPEPTFAKDGRPALDVEFHALEDDSQADPDDTLGWLEVQTALAS